MTTEMTPLWKPSAERIADANITRFIDFVNRERGAGLTDYDSLFDWSVTELESFWDAVWDFTGIIGEKGDTILKDGDKMPGAAFFPDAKVNFAENLLRRRDNSDAIVFWGEDKVKRRMSFSQLYDEVSKFAQALKAEGVGPGDRVAAFMPNMPETIVATLATASLGAVWSSCSPDFGIRGVLDRFGQIEPTVFVAVEGYYYGGKSFDTLDKITGILAELPTVKKTVIVPYTRDEPPIGDIKGGVSYADFTGAFEAGEISFTQMGFNEPLYIMFSSGTTGVPKCIVHGIGGTLIQHLKEHQLHSDVKKDDRIFYFTTCGWMMWNWLISGLASEATLLLYDGNPFHPDGNILFDYADAEKMTLFGTSAKYIDALNKSGLLPKETHDLSTVRAMTSTGSPLVPEGFDYVYRSIKSDIQLSSISGGTDIVSCFVLGNPVGPVWRGEIQTRGLGLAVNVFDDDGKPVVGEKGELVCTRPFPCMPIMFWNDPDGAKYRSAYFESYENIWCHGDYVELTPRGGMVIYGRSDAVLNPGGVRIGTAEIYRQVEKLPEVLEGLVIGQDWDDDVRVVLFIRVAEGMTLDDALIKKIKDTVRKGASPRHVPAKIIEVADIPRTKSGKIVELAVRNVVHGRPVKNVEALANPEALSLFGNRPELAD
ncbi:acetoacetate--CoA ligase [Nisaea sp.]|uniref:acetoacetate--CoA ligase n=1 Tax=Nisaea sp. TaxID=2024842 RepID=UPI003264560F